MVPLGREDRGRLAEDLRDVPFQRGDDAAVAVQVRVYVRADGGEELGRPPQPVAEE